MVTHSQLAYTAVPDLASSLAAFIPYLIVDHMPFSCASSTIPMTYFLSADTWITASCYLKRLKSYYYSVRLSISTVFHFLYFQNTAIQNLYNCKSRPNTFKVVRMMDKVPYDPSGNTSLRRPPLDQPMEVSKYHEGLTDNHIILLLELPTEIRWLHSSTLIVSSLFLPTQTL